MIQNFLRAWAIVGVVSLCLTTASAQTNDPTSARPNILILVTDDQRWDSMGAAGNDIIQTPNMDRLAAQGARFPNAFATTAICCVSRASILTGMYGSTHGIKDFATPLPDKLFAQSYPALLRAAGYHTGFVGKWGIGNTLPVDQFDVFKGFGGQGKYFNEIDGETVHMTKLIEDDAVAYLRDRTAAEPFCLSVSFKAPHVQDTHPKQFLPDPQYDALYADETMPVAPTATEEFFLEQPDLIRNTEGRVRWERRFSDADHHQRSVRDYYRLITGIDRAVGEMVQALEQTGLAENTVIILLSDHGFFLGERGLAGKWFMHEESIRIPFLLYDPRPKAATRSKVPKRTVLTIDLAPTVLALAGIRAPAAMQGRNALELLKRRNRRESDMWFYEHHFARERENFIPASEGIRTSRWKYIRYVDSEPLLEELYDLKKDPLETKNLANRETHMNRLAELRDAWTRWQSSLKPWDSPEAQAWQEPSLK